MIAFIVGTVAGAFDLLWHRTALVLLVIATVTVGWVFRCPVRMLLCLVAGAVWFASGQGEAARALPVPVAAPLEVEGWIESLPRRDGRSIRFVLRADAVYRAGEHHPWGGRLLLRWNDGSEALRVGDRWRFQVQLRTTPARSNPGGFDRGAWLQRQGLSGEGVVGSAQGARLLAAGERFAAGRLRQRVAIYLDKLVDGAGGAAAIVPALAVGDRQFMDDGHWRVLAATGTSHLMAISGLHLGMVAGFGYLLTAALWGWLPVLRERVDRRRAGIPVALVAAASYAVLAGFTLPTQRALIMLAVAAVALLLKRPVRAQRVLLLALVMVLILDPAAPRSAAFWLSFSAVGLILLHFAPHRLAKGPQNGLALQLLLGLGLVPLTVWYFQQAPWISPLANLIAIPWVGLTTVPLILLALLCMPVSDPLAATLLHLAVLTLEGLWPILEALGDLPGASTTLMRPTMFACVAAAVAVVAWAVPGPLAVRLAASVAVLPMFWPHLPELPAGAFRATVLDVGNGLAVVVETSNHTLLYDAGPAWPGGDAGRSVVLPALRQMGRNRIDTLVVSHGDGAHRGGVPAVLREMPVLRRLVGDPLAVPLRGAEPCAAGESWTWDAVQFSILHPAPRTLLTGDDASCVLLVQAAGGSALLLPGDVGTGVQSALAGRHGEFLRAEVLVAPFQGRRPDVSETFLDTVAPHFVALSLAADNRWDHPRPQTLRRLAAPGRTIVSTAEHGALAFCFPATGRVWASGWRSGVIEAAPRPHRPPGNPVSCLR